jgi:hypothetical protein
VPGTVGLAHDAASIYLRAILVTPTDRVTPKALRQPERAGKHISGHCDSEHARSLEWRWSRSADDALRSKLYQHMVCVEHAIFIGICIKPTRRPNAGISIKMCARRVIHCERVTPCKRASALMHARLVEPIPHGVE